MPALCRSSLEGDAHSNSTSSNGSPETSNWTVPPLIRDSFSMIGSAIGGTTSAFYGFNHVMPIVRRWVKGPMWLHFLIGAPPVIVFSSACAGLAGGAVPALAQLASSSYHAAVSSSSLPSTSSQDDQVHKSRTLLLCESYGHKRGYVHQVRPRLASLRNSWLCSFMSSMVLLQAWFLCM